jgi:VWFA-related protein
MHSCANHRTCKGLAIFAALAALSLPAAAARRITADQLKEIVVSANAAHRTDDLAMQQLADVQLTARLNGNALRQLIAISPGPKTTEALHAIADGSVFLEPPPDELPATPAPDIATQKAIIGRTINYVAHTLPALPNFLATRVTEHYADTMRGMEQEVSEPRGGLFFTGTYRTPISFRNGIETDDPTASLTASEKKNHSKEAESIVSPGAAKGMTSWGEFGPILGVVLVDAAKGKLGWARWEQGDGKPVAIFRFSVDRSVSHYSVRYCCETSMGSGTSAGSGYNNPAVKTEAHSVLQQAGYHGRLEVDPETGTILRIIIEADTRPGDPIQRASMMVEYGPVRIGDSTHICPTRSVSISLSRAEFLSHGDLESTNRLQLNDVEFTDYHRFGSESTLITEAPSTPSPAGQSATVAEPTPAAPAVQGTEAKSDPVKAAAPDLNAATAPPAQPTPPPSTAPPAEADSEIQIHALDGLPGPSDTAKTNDGNAKSDAGSFTLKSTTRSVDVGLMADDKHGKPVADLKQDQINIFDNGRQQQVRDFRHVTPSAAPAPAPEAPASDPGTFTNAAPAQPQDAPDLLILLLDESHLAYHDLNQARGDVLHFLAATRPTSRVALYSISERGFHVIQDVTQDHALVEKKLTAWVPDASAVSQAQALERRNRQQFDTVHSAKDLEIVNGNNIDSPETIQTLDPELRQMGDNPLRYALEGMVALARHFAPVPGHKSIAWISGDSVLADWDDQAVGMEKGSKQLEPALLHTREALNEAHIALYAVDASAIEGGAIDASIKNRNVELNPVDQNGPEVRNNTPGRAMAQMQQDTRGIQGPVRQLAESTGGRAIRKGSDLKATLDGIDRDSSSFYELGFDPDTPADGKFHTLQVKVPSRKDVVLRYRTGYLYAEESAKPQQRLQQAVWSPQDATGIALTAETISAADSSLGRSTIRLRIAFPGLALVQKGSHWADNLYIFVAQRDDAIQKAEMSGDTLRLSLKQATYDSGMPAGIPYQRAIEPKSKLGSIRVIVVDGNSGKMGSVTLPSSALHP